MITKLVCIFIKYRFVFFWSQNWFVFSLNTDLNFFQPQNWYVFYLNTDLNFFLKFFSFYEIADFEISKKELRVRLKSFFLICDACIISLSHEYESSFKNLTFLTFKNRSDFFPNQISFFLTFKKQIWFFTNQISFFFSFSFFFLTFQNRSNSF